VTTEHLQNSDVKGGRKEGTGKGKKGGRKERIEEGR
jgi:hypothetical protein